MSHYCGLVADSHFSQARWAISPDEQFRPVGVQSTINWAAEFHFYLRWLTDGLNKRKESVLNIFRVWDKALFPTYAVQHDNACGNATTSLNRGAHSMQEALDALEEDEEITDESSESGDGDE